MTTLYIVQAEESSGIPGEPMVFEDEDKAQACYEATWRGIHEDNNKWSSEYDLANPQHLRTPEELKAIVDEIMAGDFDQDWPEDGGCRFFVTDLIP